MLSVLEVCCARLNPISWIVIVRVNLMSEKEVVSEKMRQKP